MSLGTVIPREDLRALVQRVSGVSATWDDQPLGYSPGVNVLLTVASFADLGWDEEVVTFDPVHQARTSTRTGNRLLKVNVRVDSYDPEVFSLDVAETIRRRMNLATSGDALRAVNLAYTGSDSLVATTWKVDSRKCQSAIMALSFNFRVVELEVDNSGDWIEKAPLSGNATL